MLIHAIYDSKAQAYQTPYYSMNQETAIRPIADAVNDGLHPLGRNPDHYTLFYLGEFDDNSGEIKPAERKSVCNCIQLVRPPEAELFPPLAAFDNETIVENIKGNGETT